MVVQLGPAVVPAAGAASRAARKLGSPGTPRGPGHRRGETPAHREAGATRPEDSGPAGLRADRPLQLGPRPHVGVPRYQPGTVPGDPARPVSDIRRGTG